jgi:photosystem II stability/assembly factor-like uncharacterized protein
MNTAIKVFLAVAIALPFAPAWAQFSRWTPVKHIDAIDPYALVISSDGSTLVAIRAGLDPLRSFDAGATWTSFSVNGQRPLRTSFGVQIAPTNSKTWYAIGDTDGALYLTTDGGNSWTKRADTYATQYTANIVWVSANPQIIYRTKPEKDPACVFNEGCGVTHATLEISKDAGASWSVIRSVNGNMIVSPSPVDPSLVFASGPDGLSRSRDAGATWEVIVPAASTNLPYFGGNFSNSALYFDHVDAGALYVVEDASDRSRIFSTRDAGTTWTLVTGQGGRIVGDPVQKGRAFLFPTFAGAYETRDFGATWVEVEPLINGAINEGVTGVVVRNGQRFAVSAWDSTLRQLDLNNGALALTSDLWWNPAQSGWGMSITHHSSTQTFVAWFAYNSHGDPVWRVIPGGQWTDRVFKGDVYETKGPAYFGVPFDPSKVVANRVGTAQITFDDENNAGFAWQLDDGLSGNQRVTREEFGVPTAPVVDDNYADMWWNASESGWGVAINHQYNNIFAAWYAYDAAGQPLWLVMPDAKVKLDGAVPKATGAVYRTHGPSATAPFDPSQVTTQQVGSATLTFTSAGQAQLDYTVLGVTESRAVTRQPF